MKKLLIILSAVVMMASCTYVERRPQPVVYDNGYDVFVGDGGVQMTRAYYNGIEMYMEYALFNSLMNNGGWGNVYGTYQRNPTRYNNTTIVNHYHDAKPTQSYKVGADNKPTKTDMSVGWGAKKSSSSSSTSSGWGSKKSTTSTPTTSSGWGSKTSQPATKSTSSGWGSTKSTPSSSSRTSGGWGSSSSKSSSSSSSSSGGWGKKKN